MMTRALLTAVSLLSTVASAQLVVPWAWETSSIPSTRAGDPAFISAAPAPDAGVVQLVVGTDTAQVGVYAWDTRGALGQVLPIGLTRGADSRAGLLVVSQPIGALSFFTVSPDGGLMTRAPNLTAPSPSNVALRAFADGGFELWLDTTSNRLRHYQLGLEDDGGLALTQVGAELVLPQVPSGLALDDRSGRLYVALPTLGLAVVKPDETIDFIASLDGGELGDGVGGLDLYLGADGTTWLFTAVPASEFVAVHSLASATAAPVLRGQVVLGAPDGGAMHVALPTHLDVTDQYPGFDGGALIVQDGVIGNYKIGALSDLRPTIPIPAPWVASLGGGAGGGGGATGGGGGATGGGGGSTDGGATGGGGGSSGGPAPGSPDPTPSCGCSGAPLVFLPALLLLWWIRRPRS